MGGDRGEKVNEDEDNEKTRERDFRKIEDKGEKEKIN